MKNIITRIWNKFKTNHYIGMIFPTVVCGFIVLFLPTSIAIFFLENTNIFISIIGLFIGWLIVKWSFQAWGIINKDKETNNTWMVPLVTIPAALSLSISFFPESQPHIEDVTMNIQNTFIKYGSPMIYNDLIEAQSRVQDVILDESNQSITIHEKNNEF